MKNRISTQMLTTMAMLAAVSVVLVAAIHFPIPMFPPFLEYDPADIPILIATFLYGPLAGLALTAAVAVLQGVTVSSASGIIGIVMHFFATGSFALTAGLFYARKKSKTSAAVGLAVGSLVMTAVMVLMNLLLTPLFMMVPREEVIKLLMPAIIPFNLLKAGANSVVTFLAYKPISKRVLHGQSLDRCEKA